MDVNPHTSSLPIEITFAGWLIAPHANLLSYHSTPVDIEPLLFDLLLYFTLRQGTIVTRQQLIDEVWKQKFVDDNAINRAMSTLRRILKRAPDSPTFIKTHYKKGYSFVPDVNIVYAKEETPLQQETSDSSEPSAREKQPSAREVAVSAPAEPLAPKVKPLAPKVEPLAREIDPSASSETSLVAESASSANESAPNTQDKSFSKAPIAQDKGSDNQRFMPIAIASVIVVALAVLIFTFSRTSNTEKVNQDTNEALTSGEIIDAVASRTNMLSDRGVVFSPKINREKSALAYSFIPENAQRLGLYAKDLTTLRTYEIDRRDGDLFPIAWLRNEVIVYQHINAVGDTLTCEVIRATLAPDFTPINKETLFDCDNQFTIAGSLINEGNDLIYTKFNYRGAPGAAAVYGRNLTTATEYQITSPLIVSRGDYYANAAPDEKAIVYVRAKRDGSTIMLTDIEGSEQRELADVSYIVSAIAWDDDSKRISWLDPNTWQLHTLNVVSREESVLALNFDYAFNKFMGIEMIDSHRLVFASQFTDSDIVALDLNNTLASVSKVAASNSYEQSFASTPNAGTGYYLVHGNATSLWKLDDGVHKKIVDVPLKKVRHLSVSPDGDEILVANASSIIIYGDDFTSETALEQEHNITQVQWIDSDRLAVVFGEPKNAKAGVLTISTNTLEALGDENTSYISVIDKSRIAVITPTLTVKMLDIESNAVLFNQDLTGTQTPLFKADSQYIYYTKSVNQVVRRPWSGTLDDDELLITSEQGNIGTIDINNTIEANTLYISVVKLGINTLYDVQVAQ